MVNNIIITMSTTHTRLLSYPYASLIICPCDLEHYPFVGSLHCYCYHTFTKSPPKSHPSPLFPLCNTHLHNTHHLFNCTHICSILSSLDLLTALLARWIEKLAGGPQREERTPPSSKGHGSG